MKIKLVLEQIATADQELTSRKVAFSPTRAHNKQDGGPGYGRYPSLEKYGVVPKSVYPESISSSNSRGIEHLPQ